jgi:hypothetical protein
MGTRGEIYGARLIASHDSHARRSSLVARTVIDGQANEQLDAHKQPCRGRGGAVHAGQTPASASCTLRRPRLAAWRLELSDNFSWSSAPRTIRSHHPPSRLPPAHAHHRPHLPAPHLKLPRCSLGQARRRNGAVHPDRDQCGLCALQGKGQEAAQERHPGRRHCVCRGHRQRIEAEEVHRKCPCASTARAASLTAPRNSRMP